MSYAITVLRQNGDVLDYDTRTVKYYYDLENIIKAKLLNVHEGDKSIKSITISWDKEVKENE